MSGWVGGNRYLTQTEMEQNATYVYNYLSPKGWTKNAISGMLGNMQSESSINPQIWQGLDSSHAEPWGYGLVQWTPSTKLTEWAASQSLDGTQMDTQLTRIIYEKDNGLQWGTTSDYPIGFDAFATSTETPEYLANAFLHNYERPKIPDQPWRATQARTWYNFLGGVTPPPPGYHARKMPLLFYLRRNWR